VHGDAVALHGRGRTRRERDSGAARDRTVFHVTRRGTARQPDPGQVIDLLHGSAAAVVRERPPLG
jgi:hypothetical protein